MKYWQLIALVQLAALIQIKGQVLSACGLLPNLNPLIRNGYHTTHSWPWHTAIYHEDMESTTYKCGGTVIGSNSILTAAHCVTKYGVRMKRNQVVVSLGRLSLDDIEETSDVFFKVEEIVIHPNFSFIDLNNDIAIIRISKNATFNNYVRPICLWQSDKTDLSEVIGKLGTVVGWGFTEAGEKSNTLRQASLPVVPLGTCLESNRAFAGSILTQRNFCAGWRNGTNVCNGDSGGSMTFQENGTYYIRGIVSSTPAILNHTTQIAVCNSMEYAIFTDVAQYLSWIVEMTKIPECETLVRCYWFATNKCLLVLAVDTPAKKCRIIFEDISNTAVTELEIFRGESDYIPDLSHAATKFVNLESLGLERIKLKIAERARFTPFKNIKTLSLAFNRITNLDADTLDDLKNLTKLSLEFNRLQGLDVNLFSKLVNIEELYLSTNRLDMLPEDIFNNNRNIRKLSLSQNLFKNFSANVFENLHNLEKLWLTGNKLEILPTHIFRNNKNMREMYLSLNQFQELQPNLFDDLENLELMWLNVNALKFLSADIFLKNKKIREINFNRNQLEDLNADVFASLQCLEILLLSDNALVFLPSDIFNHNAKLRELDLGMNRLKGLHPDIFKELHSLEKLQLHENKMEILPAQIFRNNKKIREIILYRNLLKELNGLVFRELQNLETLDLSGNILEILPAGLFNHNEKLKKIYLRDNNIKKIDSDFHNMPQLETLDFRSNVCFNEICYAQRFCGTSSAIEMNEKIQRNCKG